MNDDLDIPIEKNRTGLIVALVVIGGVAVLAAGGYLAYKRRAPSTPTVEAPQSAAQWCQLRREWDDKVKPLEGDILLKSVREADKDERDKLVEKRNILCAEYAKKLQELLKADPALWELVKGVEEALIREGKVRANVAVEINNTLANLNAGDTATLTTHRDALTTAMVKRIKDGQATADSEVNAALGALKGFTCDAIYRGPMTDSGTSGNPHVTWDNLEVQRTLAINQFNAAIKALEPAEEFANQIYHDMMSRYRGTLKSCYAKTKKRNPAMSDALGLRVRLKKDGKVASLAIEWMQNREEKLLDCLLETAAQWQLPRPQPGMDVAIVTVKLNEL